MRSLAEWAASDFQMVKGKPTLPVLQRSPSLRGLAQPSFQMAVMSHPLLIRREEVDIFQDLKDQTPSLSQEALLSWADRGTAKPQRPKLHHKCEGRGAVEGGGVCVCSREGREEEAGPP